MFYYYILQTLKSQDFIIIMLKDHSLRLRRCCRSSDKHLDYGKIAGRVGCKQRRVPCDRRNTGGFAVCEIGHAVFRLSQAWTD